MILAAGVGSRLDPLTRNLPKPMVPIINKPVMEHIIELLARNGFSEIMVHLYHPRDQHEALCTIALSLVDDPAEYGIVLINERGKITRFLEKPKGEVIFSNMANTGVYVFEPEIFEFIPKGVSY